MLPGVKTFRARFLERPNRFVVICDRKGTPIRAYLPNPGRLHELLLPGSEMIVAEEKAGPGRKTAYTAMAVMQGGVPILLHTHHTNTAALGLLQRALIPGLEHYTVARREVTVGRSRFDFLLQKGGERMLLEVKSCTLFGREIAMFPDAVTERGRRHILELAELSRGGTPAGVLFIVHSPNIRYFMPEYHTDPSFAEALVQVRKRIMVKAVSVEWMEDLTLGEKTTEAVIPWKLVEREMADRGDYILILRVRRPRELTVGSLPPQTYRPGYYLYVGSARGGLARRIGRHLRRRKRHRWHIDYLREAAEVHGVFAVRSSTPLECRMAAAVAETADWVVPGFGSSDCGCRSHLFGMSRDPLSSRGFIERLLYFRMDRLTHDPAAADLLRSRS